ncbi:MAG TPA: type II toxin-antitoxin system VapC family toxin [Candidatus Obscuribacterales bacterium]
MAYLLDTNVCIAIIKRKPSGVLERLQRCGPGDVLISAISVAELRYGATKSQEATKAHSTLDKFLAPFEILDFDYLSAATYGAVRAALEGGGTPIGPLDTLIASQAVQNDLVLVTSNAREFSRVQGLKLENWIGS